MPTALNFPNPLTPTYPGIFTALAAIGLRLDNVDGLWTVDGQGNNETNRAAAQGLIDSYNLLAEVKKLARRHIKLARDIRYRNAYPPDLTNPTDDALDLYDQLAGNLTDQLLDLWASITNNAKAPNPAWQYILDVRTAAKTALQAISAATTIAAVEAVAAAWPAPPA